ncbi:unnamed protein product, partial [Darwinula stevensoni]
MEVGSALALLLLLRHAGSTDFAYYDLVQSGQRSSNVRTETHGSTLVTCIILCARESPGPCHGFNYRKSDRRCQLILPGNDLLAPSDGFWTFVLNEEQHAYPECLLTEKGREYVGRTNVTASGRECLTWADMPYGLPNGFLSMEHWENFLDLNASSQHNHCRNPTWREGPWCFVSDPNIQWEYCDIPMCTDLDPPEFKLSSKGREYVGKRSESISGLPCAPWLSHIESSEHLLPGFSDDVDASHRFCRNPNGHPHGPWCYVDADYGPEWEYCDVPFYSEAHGERCDVRIGGNCI